MQNYKKEKVVEVKAIQEAEQLNHIIYLWMALLGCTWCLILSDLMSGI